MDREEEVGARRRNASGEWVDGLHLDDVAETAVEAGSPGAELVAAVPFEGLQDACWMPNGERVVLVGAGRVAIAELRGDAVAREALPRGAREPIVVASSGDVVAVAAGSMVFFLDEKLDPVGSTQLKLPSIREMVFDPTGRELLAGGSDGSLWRLWAGHGGWRNPDVDYRSSTSEWVAGLGWDSKGNMRALMSEGPSMPLTVVIGRSDAFLGRADTFQYIHTMDMDRPVSAAAFGPGGSLLVWDNDHMVDFMPMFPKGILSSTMELPGLQAACIDGERQPWFLAGGRLLSYPPDEQGDGGGVVLEGRPVGRKLAPHPTKPWVLTVLDGGVQVWGRRNSVEADAAKDHIGLVLPTVTTSYHGDQPSVADHLGHAPYVRAMARFLRSEATQPPLTVSVEGDWGTGKSSFMLQLQRELERDHIVVAFNAWHHGIGDGLWAAFALEVMRVVDERLLRESPEANPKKARREAVKGGIAAAVHNQQERVLRNVGQLLLRMGKKTARKFLERTTTGKVVLSTAEAFAEEVAKEVEVSLKEERDALARDAPHALGTADYQERLSFYARFRQHLNAYLGLYAGDRKVFVIVDDLDRCDLTMAAQLLHALNLLTDATDRLFFVLGIDRAKVAAALAVHHEPLLRYLFAEPGKPDPGAMEGRRFGFAYLEKFVQLPFALPQPAPRDIDRYIAVLTGQKTAGIADRVTRANGNGVEHVETSHHEDAVTPPSKGNERSPEEADGKAPLKPMEAKALAEEVESTDSPHVYDAARMAAKFLDYNPRRIKQFVNLYRLRVLMGKETGLFISTPIDGAAPHPDQLAKFIVIGLRWPAFIAAMARDPDLLSKVAHHAHPDQSAGTSPQVQYWIERPGMERLLRHGWCTNARDIDEDARGRHDLLGVSVSALLEGTPTVLEDTTERGVPKESP